MSNSVPDPERVRIWNSVFHLAWTNAKSLHERTYGCSSKKEFTPEGGMLGDDECIILALLTFCTLAIEARTNHLIDELIELKKITAEEGVAAKRLPANQKWFLLPRLAGRRRRLASASGPHQAVNQIYGLRNSLVHLDFGQLKKKLPSAVQMLSYFERFVQAMEDMNVILGRVKRPRKKVLSIGKF